MIPKNRELPTELDASLFVKLEMLVQHLSIEMGLPKKFIVRFDLSHTGGKCRMTNVLLIIQTLVLSLNYQEPVKKSFLKPVVDKKASCGGKGNCRKVKWVRRSKNNQ